MEILIISGRIGKDAELRRLQSGNQVAQFSVAVDVPKNGEKTTNWYEATLFGDRAAKLAEYLTKGTTVSVSGRPDVRVYAGKAYRKIAVNEVTLLGGGGQDDAPHQASKPQAQKPASSYGDLDDHVPFAPDRH
jgi:single-strand DNA-binding protein